MKGDFKSIKQLTSFIEPIDHLATINGGVGIVINFIKENNEIKSNISCINSTIGVVAKLEFKNIFDDFELNDNEKLAVSKVSDFIKLFGLFDKDNSLQFVYDSMSKDIHLIQDDKQITHKTADPSTIKEYNKQFSKTPKIYSTFSYVEDFKKFSKATSVLSGEDCVFFEGSAKDQSIKMIVRNKAVVVNSFKMNIKANVSEDFVIAFDKYIIKNIIDSKYQNIVFSLGERISIVECSNDNVSATFYLANMIL